jgi:hypothetical protein
VRRALGDGTENRGGLFAWLAVVRRRAGDCWPGTSAWVRRPVRSTIRLRLTSQPVRCSGLPPASRASAETPPGSLGSSVFCGGGKHRCLTQVCACGGAGGGRFGYDWASAWI